MTETLNERAQAILKLLIEKHIQDGQAVGSKTLVEESKLALSPASVRHILAELEAKGYLIAPHTSAGRIPTELGYRFFVDSLLTIKPLNPDTLARCQRQLSPEQDVQSLLSTASSLLSGLTHMVGLVTLPKQDELVITHLEFLPLSNQKILAIIVFNDDEIQNRVLQVEKEYSRDELNYVSNFLTEKFLGQDFETVRQSLYQAMQSDKHHMNTLMEKALLLANRALSNDDERHDYLMAGQSNLIQSATQANLEKLKHLFQAFTQKQEILNLLDHCLHAQGIQIFIGSESNSQALGDFSVITSPYSVQEKTIGVLGVIGPTRMHYDKIIPIVDSTAKMLTLALNQQK